MRERTNGINLFWTIMAILAVAATVFGGYVAWKLIYSTAPKIERANVDPEELLERTVSARQEENQKVEEENSSINDAGTAQTDSEVKYIVGHGDTTPKEYEEKVEIDEENYEEEKPISSKIERKEQDSTSSKEDTTPMVTDS